MTDLGAFAFYTVGPEKYGYELIPARWINAQGSEAAASGETFSINPAPHRAQDTLHVGMAAAASFDHGVRA